MNGLEQESSRWNGQLGIQVWRDTLYQKQTYGLGIIKEIIFYFGDGRHLGWVKSTPGKKIVFYSTV